MPFIELASLITHRYRVILLDIVSFLLNIVSLFVLTRLFTALAAQANAGLPSAKVAMSIFCFAIVLLQPLGAVFKRLSAHRRNPELRVRAIFVYNRIGLIPILFYFSLQLMFLIFGSALFIEALNIDAGKPGLLAALLVSLPLLAGLNTGLVCLYFFSSRPGPLARYLESSRSELIGDGCIFLNMVCNQVFWWYLLADPFFSSGMQSFSTFAEKLIIVVLMFLFFYFPPRLFYLAENFNPRQTGISMVLANLPVLLRVLFGIG
jgi:hypothetical protein